MSTVMDGIMKDRLVAAVRKENDLHYAINSSVKTIFLLKADIFNIKKLVDVAKNNGKNILIHVDFIEGLARDTRAIDYIVKVIKPDGIISTKSAFIKHANDHGIFTIQRFFMVDSLSYKTAVKEAKLIRPDMVEIMPAIMPKVLRQFSGQVPLPIIAGGLVDTREEIEDVLNAGAAAVSTGEKELWKLAGL